MYWNKQAASDAFGCVAAALVLLTVPLNWLAAAALAALLHELGHIAMVGLLGEKTAGMTVGISGMQLRVLPMSPQHELLCAAAGPAVSLGLFLVRGLFPRAAFCGLIQGIFNLMPVMPLDGGRILRCTLTLFLSKSLAEQICKGIALAAELLLSILFLLLLAYWRNRELTILCGMLLYRMGLREKFLAKRKEFEYNRLTMHKEVRL